MNRAGENVFASTSIGKIFSYGSFRITLILRKEVTQISLSQYTETGSADHALGYDNARQTATTTRAELNFANDIYLDRGKLTTSAKLSANKIST